MQDGRSRAHGATVWLTGLPSAGKTTLAQGLGELLRQDGRRVEILDGDEIRRVISPELGYSSRERDANVARIGWLARLLARNEVTVLVPVIAPYRAARDLVRAEHEADDLPFVEVHVAAAPAVCAERDLKGLYAAQRAGRLTGLTGVDAPYEPPLAPEVLLDTGRQSVTESLAYLTSALEARGLL